MKLKLYIVNSLDRPDERHLAAWYPPSGRLRYIHPDLADRQEYFDMPATPDATPAERFGLEFRVLGDLLQGARTYPSIATYRNDGRPRFWRGEVSFSFRLPAWAREKPS
jgi:hypothetical protein